MKKTTLAILLNIPSSRNPVVLFCLRELSEVYDITVISIDKFDQQQAFPNVNFISYFNYAKWGNRLLRIINLPLLLISSSIDFFVNSALKQKQFRFSLLRNLCAAFNYIVIEQLLLPILYAQRLLRLKNLGAIISIDAAAMTAARYIKYLKKIPYAYWAYEIYPNQFIDTPKSVEALMASIERNGCKHADFVVVPLDTWAKLLRRRYRLYNLEHKIVCICPPPVIQFAELSLSGKIKFYWHGRYSNGVGLENAVRAMQNIEGGVFYLRGIGEKVEAFLKQEVTRLSLDDKVKFLPPVATERLAEEATKFDVGVVLNCLKSFNAKFAIGFKTFENIAAGLPLMAPASFPLKEIVTKNNVGIVYSNCGERALAEAFQYFVDNKEKIFELKLNARKYAEKEINKSYQGGQLLETVNALLGKNDSLQKG